MPTTRFSLLLLEPGEIYFEDFSVSVCNDSDSTPCRGRLRLCSKSVLFEPAEIKIPIMKINFCYMNNVQLEDGQLVVDCSQVTEMLANNLVSPYVFKKQRQILKFTFHYATLLECFQSLGQLHRASTLPPNEQQDMIEAIISSRHARVKFDPYWFEDFHESIVLEARVVQISPLVSNPGRLVLTSSRLYYQPYNAEPMPVLKIRLSHIERVVRRRYLLQNSALEVYYKDNSPAKYLFVALETEKLCDELFNRLEQKSTPNAIGLDVATLQWQHGVMSNYEYLLFLNSLADRSFNDLTQYPVFPWIVTDFISSTLNLDDPSVYRDLSLPIGALNHSRLKQLLERFQDMPEPKFLYGSHYMAPGFVLFYLARKHPQLVLCLHGGRFDHPDRMFNSLQQTWQNVLCGTADYKELVPEFYEGDGDFLVNYLGIDFGHRSSDGRQIQDVELPPWADSPKDLIFKLRQALESEHVSKCIHQWIDLIFGYLQKGEKAIEANNLFHPLCYEGSVDLFSIKDPAVRHMYEIQILEFGQIPRQLFTKPHPPRFAGLVPTLLPLNTSVSSLEESLNFEDSSYWSKNLLTNLKTRTVLQAHRRQITAIAFHGSRDQVLSVSLDGFLKVFRLEDGKQMLSVNPASSSPLTSYLILPKSDTIILGTLQNEIAIYQLNCCRLEQIINAHDDRVTSLGVCREKEGNNYVLASASADCTVKLWRVRQTEIPPRFRLRPASDLIADLDHDFPVASLSFHPNGDILVTGTSEGQLHVWDVNTSQQLEELSSHQNEVSSVCFSPDGSKLVSGGLDGLLQVFQFDCNSSRFSTKTSDNIHEEILCLVWDGLSILIGTKGGELLVFDLVGFKIEHRYQDPRSNPITCIAAPISSTNKLMILTGSEDGRLSIWESEVET